MESKSVTMKDIAKVTGFSTATVSRVLNGNYPVSMDTKKKVLKAMEELSYEPNLVAKNLRSKKSNLVAIVVADIQNPYYVSIAKEIDDYLFNKGYNLITCSTNESIEKEEQIIKLLLSKQIDAVAISPSDSINSKLKGLIEQNVPIVLVDRKISNMHPVSFVGSNDFKESYFLTEYLIKKGHNRIGIINGTSNTSTGEERFKGFQKAMEDYGLSINENWVLNGGFEENKARETVFNFLKKTTDIPTALLSCNNLMTKGTMIALKEAHVKIPEEISLVSLGSILNQELFNVQVTCIEHDTTFIGNKVAELLLNHLQHNKKEERVIADNIFIEGNSVLKLD